MLQFLISESDLISIVTITEGPISNKNAKKYDSKNLTARVEKVVLGEAEKNKIVKFSNKPYYSKKNSSFHLVFAYKGKTYLCFLKYDSGSTKYIPVSGAAFQNIYGLNQIRPTWKNFEKKEYLLKDILREIESKIKPI